MDRETYLQLDRIEQMLAAICQKEGLLKEPNEEKEDKKKKKKPQF